jgi:gliding motility-associated-like protein
VFADNTTGEIDLAASAPGTYVVTNTLEETASCDLRQFSYTITISAPVEATISYPETVYCANAAPVEINFEGTPGGFYSATPPGLFIDVTSGTITPAQSAPGIYTVTYTVLSAGACLNDNPSFTVEIVAAGSVLPIDDVVNCGPYVLPALTVGTYYDGPGGTGNTYAAGDEISASMTMYVFAGTGDCTDEESFEITINSAAELDPVFDVTTCSGYTLPTLTVGAYYTGPGGTGTTLNAGDVINTDQTIYVYAGSGDCSSEVSFTVSVGEVTAADLDDVTVCDSYFLPALPPFNNYYTGTGGTGDQLNVGDEITTTQTIYIYVVDGSCNDENSFVVTVNHTPVLDDLQDVASCSTYILPTLTVGNYYTGPGATGTMLAAGDEITVSQTIWVYATAGTDPVCTSETNFEVSIGSIDADEPDDVTVCDSYVLPALSANNAYWSAPGGTGTQYEAGQTITGSMTMYVHASVPGCSDESSFTITVNQTPVLAGVSDITACGSHTLGTLAVGNYYSGPSGSGTLLDGQTLTGSQTVYVYAQTGTTPNCFAETSFAVTIDQAPVVDAPADVTACASHTLEALAEGDYYTGPSGTGVMLEAGDVITSTQTLYVYAQNGECSDESSFTVTISDVPAYTLHGGCDGNSYVVKVVFADASVDASQYDYDWSVSGEGTIQAPATGSSVVVSGAAVYSVTVSRGTCEGTPASLDVANTACKIQKGISANNDGENDYFDLEGQDVQNLQIFNRYGVKVYERRNYTNQWYGQSSGGDELPDGTYYYVIDYAVGETKTGWIYINRKN